MDVMDLSLPKSHQVSCQPSPYSALQQQYQQQYLLHQQYLLQLQQQHYAASKLSATLPPYPSVNHLGFFQQIQFNNNNNTAPVAPVVLPKTSPTICSAVHQYPNIAKPTEEKEAGNQEGNCRPNAIAKRPFKQISSTLALPAIMVPNTDEAYEEYRNKVMSQLGKKSQLEPNRNMRRTIPSDPEKCNDPEYLEKRRKNNEAAKRSREARKAKEDEIAIRVSFLEKENLKLKFQLAAIERQKKMYLMRIDQQQKRYHTTSCF